jgi:uncharacterized membrane-anchored protein
MAPIDEHPLRYSLANELHARPFPKVEASSTVAYMAIKRPSSAATHDKIADRAHLIALLDRYGAAHPQPGATHYYGQIGQHMLKWESHTEFVTYTAISNKIGERPFDPASFEIFPKDWMTQAPGQLVTSALIHVSPWDRTEKFQEKLDNWFVAESVAVAWVLDNAAAIAGDFRIDPAGHLRFAIGVSPETGAQRIGRIVQRLCEIETYKTMSMLGFASVREMGPSLEDIDAKLGQLVVEIVEGQSPAETTLRHLLEASAELESMVAQSSFRHGATKAYAQIVDQRIEVLREERFEGRQTFAEFMMRRFSPAMRTVHSTHDRLQDMSDRALRAGNLLRTQVDVERSAQNQELLKSMDRRADLQLRLQRTVEGLSVVAISYYAVSLGAYLLHPVSSVLDIWKGTITSAITIPIIILVWLMVRRIRKHIN